MAKPACFLCGPLDQDLVFICKRCRPYAMERLRELRMMVAYGTIDTDNNDDPRVGSWKILECMIAGRRF